MRLNLYSSLQISEHKSMTYAWNEPATFTSAVLILYQLSYQATGNKAAEKNDIMAHTGYFHGSQTLPLWMSLERAVATGNGRKSPHIVTWCGNTRDGYQWVSQSDICCPAAPPRPSPNSISTLQTKQWETDQVYCVQSLSHVDDQKGGVARDKPATA